MRKPSLIVLAASATLFATSLASLPSLRAQPGSPNSAQPSAASLADRREALSDLFHDYWEDLLKHDPEFASTIGDLRYNDQTSDYSVQAINDELAREQNFCFDSPPSTPLVLLTWKKPARSCCCASSKWTSRPPSSKSGRCPSTRWTASTRISAAGSRAELYDCQGLRRLDCPPA